MGELNGLGACPVSGCREIRRLRNGVAYVNIGRDILDVPGGDGVPNLKGFLY